MGWRPKNVILSNILIVVQLGSNVAVECQGSRCIFNCRIIGVMTMISPSVIHWQTKLLKAKAKVSINKKCHVKPVSMSTLMRAGEIKHSFN
jgi:hypothetical protein